VALEELMLTSLIATLAHWFAPWKALYSDSKLLETGVTSVHVVATLVGGGIAVAADRDNLRTMKGKPHECPQILDELHATHRPVLIGLAFLFVSGVALAAADIDTFAKSPVFLAKLILVFLLCLNGLFLARTEHLLRRRVFAETAWPDSVDPTPVLCQRLRTASWLSLTLWLATAVIGVALQNV
jgi:hypothetical protein